MCPGNGFRVGLEILGAHLFLLKPGSGVRSRMQYCCCCYLFTQLCPTFRGPMDCSPLGFSVHGICQVRKLEWVVISFSRGSSWPRDWTLFSCLSGRFLITEPPGKPSYSIEKSESESCSVVSDSLQPRGLYTVHGILQARILEWVAFLSSRGSSQSRDRTQVSHIAGRFFTSWAVREAQKCWNG